MVNTINQDKIIILIWKFKFRTGMDYKFKHRWQQTFGKLGLMKIRRIAK